MTDEAIVYSAKVLKYNRFGMAQKRNFVLSMKSNCNCAYVRNYKKGQLKRAIDVSKI